MANTLKPAIPPVPKEGEDRTRFDTAIKECMEIIIGRRLATVKELNELGYGWTDLLSDALSRATGPKAAPYNVFRANGADEVFGYEMDTTARVISGQSHMPHDWAVGTRLYLHAHWAAVPASVRTTTFRFAWSYARGYGVEAFSAPAGVDVTQAHCNIAYGHNIAEFSDAQAILPLNCETDGLFLWSLRASAQGATSVAYNPFIFMVDMHYQTDGRSTNERNRTATGFSKMTYEDDLVAKINEILSRLQ
jgi:hypothetical protein